MKKIKKGILAGTSGEYFVAAELSRRGYIASITLKNTKGIDILVSNEEASKTVAIQVKTNSSERKAWVLNEKAEEYKGPALYYVFVNLKNKVDVRPDFHIVPSEVVANYIKKEHDEWLLTPGKRGQPHKETPMRMFGDKDDAYLEKWEKLGLD